jgi:hypothetical protein
MKTKKATLEIPNASFELEMARRLAAHHVHVAGRIVMDALPYAPFKLRQTYTSIGRALNTFKRHLDELAPGVELQPSEHHVTVVAPDNDAQELAG